MLGLTICLTVPHINAMHVNNEPRDSIRSKQDSNMTNKSILNSVNKEPQDNVMQKIINNQNEIRNEILRTKYEIMIVMKKKENRLIDLILGIRNDINKNIEGNTLYIAKFISTSNIEDAKQFNSIAKQIDNVEEEITEHINNFENGITERINNLETGITERIYNSTLGIRERIDDSTINIKRHINKKYN